jgi:hypothetical protein
MWTNWRNLIKMNQHMKCIWLPFVACSCCLSWYSRKGGDMQAPPCLHNPQSALRWHRHKSLFCWQLGLNPRHTPLSLFGQLWLKDSVRVRFHNGWGLLIFYMNFSGSFPGASHSVSRTSSRNAHCNPFASWILPWGMTETTSGGIVNVSIGVQRQVSVEHCLMWKQSSHSSC